MDFPSFEQYNFLRGCQKLPRATQAEYSFAKGQHKPGGPILLFSPPDTSKQAIITLTPKLPYEDTMSDMDASGSLNPPM